MKMLLALALISISTLASAKVSTITCLVKEDFEGKIKDIKVEFLVSNLGSKKATLENHPKADLDMGAIYVFPEMVGKHYSNMTHLNGQGGDLRVSEDSIRLFGDGDGYTFVDLVLYKNSDYKDGFVRVSGSGDKFYQTLHCSVK